MNLNNHERDEDHSEQPHHQEFDDQFWKIAEQLDKLWETSQMNGIVGIEKVGRYELVRCLGEGAFGVVFLSFDPVQNRKVAIKIPLPESLCHSDRLESFASEFTACKSIIHPGLVQIYETGFGSGIPYIASEYIDGPTLADWLDADQPLPTWQMATELLIKIATAIACIHQHGILHGDLKPSNILLQKIGHPEVFDLANWNPKLSDFGLASQQADGKWPRRNGIPLGSPRYLAPELFSHPDSALGPVLDAYSFGVIMFELLTGHHPFEKNSMVEFTGNMAPQKTPSLLEFDPTVPQGLDDAVQGCLCKNPADRLRSFPDLITLLHQSTNPSP